MNKLIGRYKLLNHGTYSNSEQYTPTSDYLKGEICYAADKSLSVLILFKPEIETKKDILCYVGTYEVVSDELLIHKFHLCSQQKRNNSDEERSYLFRDNNLVLGAKLQDGGRFEAVWERI